jgi:hypothetical protein
MVLNLPKLYSLASHLDLPVFAAHTDQVAVRVVADQVTRLVQPPPAPQVVPGTFCEPYRVADERSARLLSVVEVASGEDGPFD